MTKLTDEQIMNIADSYSFTWDEGIVAFARALLSASKPAAIGKQGARDAFDAWNDEQTALEFEDAEAENHARLIFSAGYNASPAAPAPSGEPVEADVVPNEIAELLAEPCWNLSRRDVSDLLKRIGSILYAAPQPSQPVEAGEGETS